MKYSGIGGQAVMEGVMMQNGGKYAVAVRKSDGKIVIETSTYTGVSGGHKFCRLPIIRGVFRFIDSLSLGLKTLSFSASFFEEEEEKKTDQKKEKFAMGVTLAFSVALAVIIFMLLPFGLSLLFGKLIASGRVLALLEGALRLLIFLGYVAGISLMPDIKRVYMYHGAEHKCINCVENGMDLTVENVRKSSRFHKRCGTSFLLLVMFVSILLFLLVSVKSAVLRLALRLALIPVIAGISYELIRLAGRSDHFLVSLISAPGLLLQKMTTREPDDGMIEVAIASVEAVFDWKTYVEEVRSREKARHDVS